MTFPWLFGKFSYSKTLPWLSMTAIFPGFSMTVRTLCIAFEMQNSLVNSRQIEASSPTFLWGQVHFPTIVKNAARQVALKVWVALTKVWVASWNDTPCASRSWNYWPTETRGGEWNTHVQHTHPSLFLLWFGCRHKHLTDPLLLIYIILLQQFFVQPVWMCYPWHGVRHLQLQLIHGHVKWPRPG